MYHKFESFKTVLENVFQILAYQKQQQYETSRPPPPPNPPPKPPVVNKEKAPEPFSPPQGIEIPDGIELVRNRKFLNVLFLSAISYYQFYSVTEVFLYAI